MTSVINKHSILIVDDEAELLELTKDVLEPYFKKIFIANCVSDALTTLKNHKVDLVLSDYKMPVHDGLALRSMMINDFPKVHFIMLTGFGDDPKIEQAKKQYNFEVLNKPTRPDVLVKRILSSIYGSQIYTETTNEYINKLSKNEKAVFSNLDEISKARNLQKFALNKKIKQKS